MKRYQVKAKIGRLTLEQDLGLVYFTSTSMKKWLCRCDCGKTEEKLISNILRSAALGTGCSDCGKKQKAFKKTIHGDTNSPLHKIWMRMRYRCNSKNATAYKWYGGKGIKITPDWNTFKEFKLWAEQNGFEDGLTIDRINPDKNYSPDNCRFLTKSENSRYARIYRRDNNV